MRFNAQSAITSITQISAVLHTVVENGPENPFAALPTFHLLGKLQSKAVHKGHHQGRTWRWEIFEHLVVAAYVFPLTVKCSSRQRATTTSPTTTERAAARSTSPGGDRLGRRRWKIRI